GVPASRIARWEGSSWAPLGSGVGGQVLALGVFDDGGGDALYAGGALLAAGGNALGRIARWNGAAWSALGTGIGDAPDFVLALDVFDDGSGAALYAGGLFTIAGGA